MNKKMIWAVLLSVTFCSCKEAIVHNEKTTPEETLLKKDVNQVKPHGNANLIVNKEADIPGFWVGMFEPDTLVDGISAGEYYWDQSNKINISIDKIEQGKVTGYSIVAGNIRPFTGEMNLDNNVYSFKLKEPGDNKYDGTFEFSITKQDSLLNGTWHSFAKLKISGRKYALQKKLFRYDPSLQMDGERYVDWRKSKKVKYNKDEEDADYDESYFTTTDEVTNYNASVDPLTEKQVSNMKKGDLFVLRNAIYARHGYSFKNQQLRAYFDLQSWYIPVATDVKNQLTPIEKENITLLLRYEKNAREYYDVFGRG